MMLMGTVSNLVLTKVVSAYSNVAIAGMGIAKKIDTLAFAISNGMTQGVLPLIAYNHAAKNFERMRAAVKTAFTLNILSGIVGTAVLFLGAVPIMKFFIADACFAAMIFERAKLVQQASDRNEFVDFWGYHHLSEPVWAMWKILEPWTEDIIRDFRMRDIVREKLNQWSHKK